LALLGPSWRGLCWLLGCRGGLLNVAFVGLCWTVVVDFSRICVVCVGRVGDEGFVLSGFDRWCGGGACLGSSPLLYLVLSCFGFVFVWERRVLWSEVAED
jgi:hypothetical protein